jgi:D-alanyl-lipoteichoic acid acyltransferase DltB (MBOAT superfamily)
MLFNSVEFLVFLAIVYAVYRLLNLRWQNLMLLVAGYVFYGWWDVRFLYLITLSTTVDYCAALLIHHSRLSLRQRLTASLTIIAAAFFFVVLDWHTVHRTGAWSVSVNWGGLLPGWGWPWIVLCASIGGVALGHLACAILVRARQSRRRRLAVAGSIICNLGILGFFKYFNFFVDSANSLLASAGFNPASFRLHLILPVGISFYTFQSMSYVIDVYRGRVAP